MPETSADVLLFDPVSI